MKYLKTKNISKHSVSDRSFIIEQPSGKITTNSQDSIKIPTGLRNRRPLAPDEGMIRFTTNSAADHEDVNISNFFGNRPIGIEAYFDGEWRPIRLQGPATITKFNAGVGSWDVLTQPNESLSVYFPASGDALPIVPAGPDNIIVIVENVFQISGTNFELVETDGEIIAFEITNPGSGYTTMNISITTIDSTGGGAAVTPVLDGGTLDSITINNSGSGYNDASLITVSITGDGVGAAASARIIKPGWHIKFLSAVPDTKPVTVYFGFDQ